MYWIVKVYCTSDEVIQDNPYAVVLCSAALASEAVAEAETEYPHALTFVVSAS